ncbi:MAG: hypothetical protein QMD00_03360 [Hadesarchaea archaeon]|nr:hypothetical protein [Hadesarchaea archaeon]
MLRRLPLLAIIVVAASIGIATPIAFAKENMATVQGTIYDLWSFTPLENVKIVVYSDSTLRLQTVSLDGTYSLSLSPGSYTIKAKYYSGAVLVYDAEENIALQAGDNLLLDLIMFPTFEENELPENHDILPDEEEAGAEFLWLGVATVLILVVVGVVVFYHRKIMGLVEKEVTAPPSRIVGLPEDLKEVVEIVRGSGGRINQVELRQKLPYSEAKVSLMIADLEDRGLIRKIKKGRGNIIVLTELE